MYARKKINNERFTVRFCNTAKDLGFTHVGPFEKFLKQIPCEDIRIFVGPRHVKVNKLLDEISQFKTMDEQQ